MDPEPALGPTDREAIAPLFNHIQIEGEHEFGKPDERAYLHAMNALGVEPHETWWFADRFGARRTLTVCGLAWSLTTIATGAVTGLASLFGVRLDRDIEGTRRAAGACD